MTRESIIPRINKTKGEPDPMKITTILCLALILFAGIIDGMSAAPAPVELVQVRQDFSSDPGWDNWNNRVVGENCPTVVQDFGWSPTSHFDGKPGEIGGTIWRSTTPAWYAMPIGKPLSFKDSFSASGRVVVMPGEAHGSFYFGFFNAERPGWRCWSSLAICLMQPGNRDCRVDYKTGTGRSYLYDYIGVIQPDGKPHTWALSYDPEGVPDPLQMEADGVADSKGRITFTLDGHVYTAYLLPGHCDEPTAINRFGIYNEQVYSGNSEIYFSDLVVNGHKIDLSKDPH